MGIQVFMGTTLLGCVCLAAAACQTPSPSGSPSTALCLPEPLHIDKTRVPAGDSVIVSSDGFKCGASYAAGKKYHLRLGFVGRAAPIDLGDYAVNRNGSFVARVIIPVNSSPGDAYIIVTGSSFDECSEVEPQSCAGYDIRVVIVPPSQ